MKGFKRSTLAIAVLLLCANLLLAGSKAPKPGVERDEHLAKRILEAIVTLERGFHTLDQDSLEKARFELIEIVYETKEKDPLALYYAALADYRMVYFLFAKQRQNEASHYVQEGLKYLEAAINLSPQFADAYALCGSMLGFQIALEPNESMMLGMKISGYFDMALRQEPKNPRVNYLMARNLLYTPPQFGGGVDKAISYFEKAIKYYDEEKPSGGLKPSWGREEAYASLGVVYLEYKKDPEKAKELLTKALEISPNYSYARWKLSTLVEGGEGE